MRRFDDALESFSAAAAIRPSAATSQLHRAFALLALGRLREGFDAYEWRRRGPKPFVSLPDFTKPELGVGEDPRGKRVLLYGEQGLGDMIQFARLVRPLAAKGAKVVLAVQPALTSLFASLGPDIAVAPPEAPLPPSTSPAR